VANTYITTISGAFRKIAKSDHELRRVCLSVRVDQLCCHWKDFLESSFLSIFKKKFEKSQLWLKSDKNNGYFTWRRMYIYGSILLDSS
jgi:hypothetical protein